MSSSKRPASRLGHGPSRESSPTKIKSIIVVPSDLIVTGNQRLQNRRAINDSSHLNESQRRSHDVTQSNESPSRNSNASHINDTSRRRHDVISPLNELQRRRSDVRESPSRNSNASHINDTSRRRHDVISPLNELQRRRSDVRESPSRNSSASHLIESSRRHQPFISPLSESFRHSSRGHMSSASHHLNSLTASHINESFSGEEEEGGSSVTSSSSESDLAQSPAADIIRATYTSPIFDTSNRTMSTHVDTSIEPVSAEPCPVDGCPLNPKSRVSCSN